MADFPTEEEEFELMYNDELDLIREQEEDLQCNEPSSKGRKFLDFSTPSASTANENAANTQTLSQKRSFEDTFTTLSQNHSQSRPSQTNIPENDPDESLISRINHVEPSNIKKRPIQDLFGDIDDLLFEEEANLKKHKGNKEHDLALIDYITNLRQQNREKNSATILRVNRYTANTERDKNNLSHCVPKYPFFGVTRHDGEKVYVRFHSDDYEKEETLRIVKECSSDGVWGDTLKNTWNEARQMINRELDDDGDSTKVDEEVQINEPTDASKQLWVDLYKPKKYLELLSDESTNRTMLRWMKLWDKVVFNRNPKIKSVEEDPNGKKKFFNRNELSTKLDEHGRPEHKVALLCGPPGLGKTTLAHMVAKHAGYNVIEVNASDDRSTEAFKKKLENATQMRSVLDREKRPNCLIFDEIDGAPQSSIDYLIKFINGTATSKPKKGTKTTQTEILKRPIICICNDVYVPALRPLRQIAFVVNFPQTSSARLAERLMEIARRQHVQTDVGAMLALAEKSNNDIRSCLSVLHFFKAQNKPVRLSDIHRANVGQKDMQKGLFSVWNDIFQIERPKVKSGANIDISLKTRMKKILNTISSFGDYERVAQGVFENFPNINIKDSGMVCTCEALEWFCFNDLISKQVYELQNYSLQNYLQYGFVVWHFTFSSLQKQKLQYPSAGYEARLKKTRQAALISEVMLGMQPSVRCFCQPISLILDILPLLTRIIVPPFRPVNLHLYTKEEKDTLLRVVNVMIDYNLNYIQERSPDGTYVYNLEPNVEQIVIFDINDPNNRRKTLSYPNKQLIAREIEMEKMRRLETLVHKTNENMNRRIKETEEKTKNANGKNVEKETSLLPNHLQTLKARVAKAKVETVLRKDFFGRIIANPGSSREKAGSTHKNDIWYRYKEGYNNAVKKNIKISSLK